MKRRLRFSLLTLLLVLTFCAIALTVVVRRPTPLDLPKIESSLRLDLGIADSDVLHILKFDPNSDTGRWGPLEQAVIVTKPGETYRLAAVVREPRSPNPRFANWWVGQISIMYTDGHDEWETFEKQFANYPSSRDVEKFYKWVKQW